jgi:hypothetical protein
MLMLIVGGIALVGVLGVLRVAWLYGYEAGQMSGDATARRVRSHYGRNPED